MSEWWGLFIGSLSNREYATGTWLLGLITFLLIYPASRPALLRVVRAALHWRLVLLFGAFALYTAGVIALISWLGLWQVDQFVATIVWYLFSGMSLVGRALAPKEGLSYFTGVIRDNFRLAIVFEFVFAGFSFGINTEMIIVPILVFLGLLLAVAESEERFRVVRLVLEFALAAFVVLVLWWSFEEIIRAPEDFFVLSSARNFLLPILMSVSALPFAYVMYCYSEIESVKTQINLKRYQPDRLKQYALRRFVRVFACRPVLLRRAARQFHSVPVESEADVEAIIREIRNYERARKQPPIVGSRSGWSPHWARDVLLAEGLQTGDYHSTIDGWWASSPIVQLDDEILPNTVALYLSGTESVIKSMKLKGHFVDEFSPSVAVEAFRKIAEKLVRSALPQLAEEELSSMKFDGDFVFRSGSKLISLKRERFPSEVGFNLTLEIRHS